MMRRTVSRPRRSSPNNRENENDSRRCSPGISRIYHRSVRKSWGSLLHQHSQVIAASRKPNFLQGFLTGHPVKIKAKLFEGFSASIRKAAWKSFGNPNFRGGCPKGRVATIRENQGKFWPSGKSGKVREFQIFLLRVWGSQGKWSGWGDPKFVPDFQAYFCKKPVVAGAKFFPASLGISRDTHQICVVGSGKVREKCAEKFRESQGIQIELTGGNPLNCMVYTLFCCKPVRVFRL